MIYRLISMLISTAIWTLISRLLSTLLSTPIWMVISRAIWRVRSRLICTLTWFFRGLDSDIWAYLHADLHTDFRGNLDAEIWLICNLILR